MKASSPGCCNDAGQRALQHLHGTALGDTQHDTSTQSSLQLHYHSIAVQYAGTREPRRSFAGAAPMLQAASAFSGCSCSDRCARRHQ